MRVRALVLSNIVAFVREQYGDLGHDRILESVTPQTRRTVGSSLRSSRWLPLRQVVEYMERGHELLCPGDSTFFRRMGRHAAKHDASLTHHSLLTADRATAVRRVDALWRSFVDSARAEVLSLEPGALTIRVSWSGGRLSACEHAAGGLEVFFSARAVAHPLCTGRGDPYCDFVVIWAT